MIQKKGLSYEIERPLRPHVPKIIQLKNQKKKFFFCLKIILKSFFYHFEGRKKFSIFFSMFYMGVHFHVSGNFTIFFWFYFCTQNRCSHKATAAQNFLTQNPKKKKFFFCLKIIFKTFFNYFEGQKIFSIFSAFFIWGYISKCLVFFNAFKKILSKMNVFEDCTIA